MELISIEQSNSVQVQKPEFGSRFLNANTTPITFAELKKDCIIPVFAKDNESTISHIEFINVVNEAVQNIFPRERICEPSIVVSHPIKGRIPSAVGKPANELKDHEKTIYYERMAFMIEVNSIKTEIEGNPLSLTIGGVRAYNLENLFSRKSAERFKLFIGFKNSVCTNLCISTDGFNSDVKTFNLHELFENTSNLIGNYNQEKQIGFMSGLNQQVLSEEQFCKLIGRSKMYQHMPLTLNKCLPELPFGDSQLNSIIKGYYSDEYFSCKKDGSLDLWRLYNLFTGALKSSYIDSYLDKCAMSHSFISKIQESIRNNSDFWYLN